MGTIYLGYQLILIDDSFHVKSKMSIFLTQKLLLISLLKYNFDQGNLWEIHIV